MKFSSAFAEIYICSFLTNFSLKLLSSLFSSVDGEKVSFEELTGTEFDFTNHSEIY